MRLPRHGIVALVAVCLSLAPADAESASIGPGTFDFNGTFTAYNQEARFELQLGTAMLLEAATSSYALGGFDPILTLLDSSGNLVTDNDDKDPAGDFDSLIVLSLSPGVYVLALTQSSNLFEPQFGRFGYASTDCDAGFASCAEPFGDRSGSFALQISLTTVADVPEPATLTLVGLGLVALARRRRRLAGRPDRPVRHLAAHRLPIARLPLVR